MVSAPIVHVFFIWSHNYVRVLETYRKYAFLKYCIGASSQFVLIIHGGGSPGSRQLPPDHTLRGNHTTPGQALATSAAVCAADAAGASNEVRYGRRVVVGATAL